MRTVDWVGPSIFLGLVLFITLLGLIVSSTDKSNSIQRANALNVASGDGRRAYAQSISAEANPYRDQEYRVAWLNGWMEEAQQGKCVDCKCCEGCSK